MTQGGYRPNSALLGWLLVPAIAYLAWQYYMPFFTGMDLLDGSIGVMLGLYICSRPAANGMDLIFFDRGALSRIFSGAAGLRWIALNALIMVVGWFVIVIGAARFTHRAV